MSVVPFCKNKRTGDISSASYSALFFLWYGNELSSIFLLISSLFVATAHEMRYISATLCHFYFISSISFLLRETMPTRFPRLRLPRHTMSANRKKIPATMKPNIFTPSLFYPIIPNPSPPCSYPDTSQPSISTISLLFSPLLSPHSLPITILYLHPTALNLTLSCFHPCSSQTRPTTSQPHTHHLQPSLPTLSCSPHLLAALHPPPTAIKINHFPALPTTLQTPQPIHHNPTPPLTTLTPDPFPAPTPAHRNPHPLPNNPTLTTAQYTTPAHRNDKPHFGVPS